MPIKFSARKFGSTQTFGSIETPIFNQMFNLYSENNRILETGDHCLFLLTNISDYFAPVIVDGVVLFSTYLSGEEKLLYINPTRIIDDERITEMSLYGKKFSVYTLINNQTNYTLHGHPKLVLLTKKEFDSLYSNDPSRTFFNTSNYSYQCFAVNCFFIRSSHSLLCSSLFHCTSLQILRL